MRMFNSGNMVKRTIKDIKVRGLLLLATVMIALPTFAVSVQNDTLMANDSSFISQRNMTADASHRENIIHDVRTITINPNHEQPTHQDSIESLLRMFYMDQFRQFHDPEAPHFMFMTQDANLAMGVGGKLCMRGWYDWNGSQDSFEFYPININVPPKPSEKRMLGGSMESSSIFMTLLGRRSHLRYMVYFRIDWLGSSLSLRRAYITLNDFTIGFAPSTFVDLDAIVPTVDGQGPNGIIFRTQILGRYFHTFKSGWSLGAGICIPKANVDIIADQTESCRSFCPDITGLVQYGWNEGASHVRLAGLLRTISYRNLIERRNHNIVGWGAQLSAHVNVINPLSIYFTGAVGQGIGSYQGDLAVGNYDLVGIPEKPGVMKAPWCYGITAGVKYDISRKVFACAGFGQARYLNSESLYEDEYKYGLYGCVNVFWRFSSRLLAGIEYINGKRMNYNGDHASSDRIGAIMTFSF